MDAIDKALAAYTSVDIAKFDETMTLLQRDRNAAWFSRQDGARLLVCSEIGSEGRNFQFVHHLFLFDLPRNPELLKQRIGRVDRIGQKNDIQIHVPFILGSVYEILAKWYMDGLNLFEKNINGVHLIYQKFRPGLSALFKQSEENNAFNDTRLREILLQTKKFCITVDKKISRGKNILLEMNSFKPDTAKKIISRISRAEKNKTFEDLLIRVLDHYGIEVDFIDQKIFKLNPDTMTDENFPAITGLPDAMTFTRSTAIVRDDIDFFSWDHPFVQQTFDFFLTNGTGSCATALVTGKGTQGILLETVFVLECIAPEDLNLEQYLVPDPIRIVIDHKGNHIDMEKDSASLLKKMVPDQSRWFMDMEQVRQEVIPDMIEKSRQMAETRSEMIVKQGKARIKQMLGQEITRLARLKKINPDIREAEITLARTRMASLLEHLASARPRMDALRLIRVQ